MIPYSVSFSLSAEKEIKKMEREVQRLLFSYIRRNLANSEDPRIYGKALTGRLKGLWRYRIGDYRLLVEIQDKNLLIIALDFDHRSRIYKDNN